MNINKTFVDWWHEIQLEKNKTMATSRSITQKKAGPLFNFKKSCCSSTVFLSSEGEAPQRVHTPLREASERKEPPPVCCWNTSIVSSSSISSCAGVSVSLIGCPSNLNRICLIDKPCLSQYAFISLLSGVCLLILNWTTDPSWPATFRLMWSFSVFTPSFGFSSDIV